MGLFEFVIKYGFKAPFLLSSFVDESQEDVKAANLKLLWKPRSENKKREENETKLKSIKGDVLKSWLNPHKSFSFFKTVELLPFLIFSLQLYIISIFVFIPLHKIIFLKTELKNCLKFSFFFLRQKNEKPEKIMFWKSGGGEDETFGLVGRSFQQPWQNKTKLKILKISLFIPAAQ